MSEQHVKQFMRAFEQEAFDAADEANLPLGVMAELSTAISLKRIADALTNSYAVEVFGNQLLDIAYKAGMNFRGSSQ